MIAQHRPSGKDRNAVRDWVASGFHQIQKEGDMNVWSMALAYHTLSGTYHLLHTS